MNERTQIPLMVLLALMAQGLLGYLINSLPAIELPPAAVTVGIAFALFVVWLLTMQMAGQRRKTPAEWFRESTVGGNR